MNATSPGALMGLAVAAIAVLVASAALADDAAATKAEIATWLAERLGVPPPRFTGLPATGRREVTPDRVIVNAKARALLGWHPEYPTFREGYKKILSR